MEHRAAHHSLSEWTLVIGWARADRGRATKLVLCVATCGSIGDLDDGALRGLSCIEGTVPARWADLALVGAFRRVGACWARDGAFI